MEREDFRAPHPARDAVMAARVPPGPAALFLGGGAGVGNVGFTKKCTIAVTDGVQRKRRRDPPPFRAGEG